MRTIRIAVVGVAIGLALPSAAGGEDLCQQAQALVDAKRSSEAVKVYMKALQTPATFTCAKQGLAKLAPAEQPESVWDWTKTATENLGSLLGFLALVFAGLAGLWLLGKAAWGQVTGASRKPRVTIDDFGSEELEKPLGPGFSQLMRTELIESRWGDDRIDVVTAQDTGKDALESLTSALPDSAKPLGAALTFLEMLSARPVLTVSGTLHRPTTLGSGASMLVASGGSATHATDLWARDLQLPANGDESETMRRVSIPAAAFIRHVYTERWEADPLMGGSAYGWALFRMAQSWHREGEYAKAKRLCERALDRDPANALANGLLGQVLAQMPGNDAAALAHLDLAIAALEAQDAA